TLRAGALPRVTTYLPPRTRKRAPYFANALALALTYCWYRSGSRTSTWTIQYPFGISYSLDQNHLHFRRAFPQSPRRLILLGLIVAARGVVAPDSDPPVPRPPLPPKSFAPPATRQRLAAMVSDHLG